MVDGKQVQRIISVWALALVCLTHANISGAQDCVQDVDCGHGFQCMHESGGNSSVTGVGGSTMPECGDGICDSSAEDVDSCPEDCDTIQFCAPAECTSDADCAEGYECGEEVGSNSGSTSVGGSANSVCGDDFCDFDESNATCPDDCRTYRVCQVARVVCLSDDDCSEGFFCYLVGSNSVGVAAASVDSGTDTATDGSDGSNDSASADGDSSSADGFAPPATTGGDESGVCLPEIADTTNGSNNNVSTVGGETVGSSNSSGGDSASNAADSGSGTGGSGGLDTGASNASNNNVTSSDAGGASGGGDGDGGDDDAGCSCALAGDARGSSGLALLLLGLVLSLCRRPGRRR